MTVIKREFGGKKDYVVRTEGKGYKYTTDLGEATNYTDTEVEEIKERWKRYPHPEGTVITYLNND